jgi:hypothetical protein
MAYFSGNLSIYDPSGRLPDKRNREIEVSTYGLAAISIQSEEDHVQEQ